MKTRQSKKHTWLLTFSVILSFILLMCTFIVLKLRENIQYKDTIELEIGEIYDYEKVESIVQGRKYDLTNFFEISENVDFTSVGEYKIRYTPKIWGFKAFERKIKIKDTQKPKITLLGEKFLRLQDINDFEEPGFSAIDNADGDITSKVITKITEESPSTYKIEYQVIDSSGNIVCEEREVKLIRGNVYLTFDDGPSKEITPKILDILKEKNVSATFFVIGFSSKNEELIKREAEEGHTIGFHGMTHDYSQAYASIDSLMENFHELESKVESVTGIESSKIIRFPGGSSNTVSKKYCKGIMSEATKKVTEEGYTYFDWNVDSRDAGGAKTAEEVYENVISGIKPGRNNIILMHDSAGHRPTLEALERIIDYCLEEGYEFKAITSETKPVTHSVAN